MWLLKSRESIKINPQCKPQIRSLQTRLSLLMSLKMSLKPLPRLPKLAKLTSPRLRSLPAWLASSTPSKRRTRLSWRGRRSTTTLTLSPILLWPSQLSVQLHQTKKSLITSGRKWYQPTPDQPSDSPRPHLSCALPLSWARGSFDLTPRHLFRQIKIIKGKFSVKLLLVKGYLIRILLPSGQFRQILRNSSLLASLRFLPSLGSEPERSPNWRRRRLTGAVRFTIQLTRPENASNSNWRRMIARIKTNRSPTESSIIQNEFSSHSEELKV